MVLATEQGGIVARLSALPLKQFRNAPTLLKDATISDFGGGLNVVDNDVTMKSRFAKVLDNWNKRGSDGSMTVRWGTKFKYDVTGAVTGTLIELAYFAKHILAFTTDGQIAKITEAGVITAIWNDAIAGALVGAPYGWSTGLAVGQIDVTEFKGELLVCNGVDKPLIIYDDLTVNYLNDPSSGSNVNTPIGRYCTTVSNYAVIAGVTDEETDIYISAQGTSGAWLGDPDPNDSVVISIGAWVPQNSGEILGIGSFRNFLLVAFEGALVVVELGAYDSTGLIHKPAVQDNIVSNGIISHRTMVATRNDFVMADTLGWHKAVRTAYGLIDTEQISELINPEYIPDVPTSTDDRRKCFSVRNQLESRIMTFLPDDTGAVTVWTATSEKQEKIANVAWNTYSGWTFTCGCSSERGRVFLGDGTKIYQYGNEVFEDEDYSADYLDDADGAWMSSTNYAIGDTVEYLGDLYIALVAHTAGIFASDLANDLWEPYLGDEISFVWEMPWTDINSRARKKFLHYIQADTRGAAQFDIQVFFDNFYTDAESGELIPHLSMGFVGGDALGYGGGDQPYGGGRRLQDERPWNMPGEFKLMKLRLVGTSREPLSMITLTILYHIGTFRRQ